jgi:DNA-binding transcriptional LysR family regulator
MLDVRRMRVLREVAQRGSFSAAAEALAYTQSAVSQQIAALEREAGTKLVERSARGVRLTDAGQVVVRHADAILARLADAEAELEAIAGLRGGRLRLGAFPSAGASVMPRAIALYRERHPAVDLTLQPAEPEDGIALLRSGEIDIAMTIATTYDDVCMHGPGIEEHHLLDDPMYVILPATHSLAHRRSLRLSDLAEEQWMLGSTGSCPDSAIFLRACQTAGFEPRIAFSSNDYPSIQGFVAAGMGLAFVPDLALINLRDDVVVRSLGARPPIRRIMAATLSGSYASPAREAMLAVLREVGTEFGAARRELSLAS